MKVHELKTWPQHFGEIVSGVKAWELRRDDRDFHVGDLLNLLEYNAVMSEYTGRSQLVEIVRIRSKLLGDGLAEGFVIMDIRCVKLEVV